MASLFIHLMEIGLPTVLNQFPDMKQIDGSFICMNGTRERREV